MTNDDQRCLADDGDDMAEAVGIVSAPLTARLSSPLRYLAIWVYTQ